MDHGLCLAVSAFKKRAQLKSITLLLYECKLP